MRGRCGSSSNAQTSGRAAGQAHQQHHQLGGEQHREDLQHMLVGAEHAQAPTQQRGGVGHHRIGERVLAEQARLSDIHREPEGERRAESDPLRLAHDPEQQRERGEVRFQPGEPAGPGQQVEQQRGEQRRPHE
jgi:hypothetical protein